LAVHWLVDSLVVFLALFVLALILGVPILAVVGVAAVVGGLAAPSTRRAEERALAARAHKPPAR
jgi:hypothetical protein